MLKRLLAIALGARLQRRAFCRLPREDLLQIYRDALASDPMLASARANWAATQENVPQARAGLLPAVGLAGQRRPTRTSTKESTSTRRNKFASGFRSYGYTVSASQPLYRPQNLDRATIRRSSRSGRAITCLPSAQQDLIVRVAQAYFDVLLARFNIELTESQKAAVSENLAQAKRNFEVGTATITDTNDAQAKYDQIVAQEIAARNDLDNKLAALRAIIGRLPEGAEALRRQVRPAAFPRRTRSSRGSSRRCARTSRCASRRPTSTSRRSKSTGSAPAHYPTRRSGRELQPGLAGGSASTSVASSAAFDSRLGADRRAAQRAAVPGRRDRFARAAGDRQPGRDAAGSRERRGAARSCSRRPRSPG